MTKAVSSITGLLSGKLKNASVSSITTELINVFTKPNASAQQLLTTLLKVQSELEDVQRLSKKIDISLLTSSQLDSLRTRQSKVDSARSELSSRRDTLKREAYQKYEDIDVYQMAWAKKSAKKQTAKEIATNIGIDPDKVTSADAEQLQTYIKTLALLRQLIDARKEYGEIHTSNDAANYLKQEQQISKVFQEVLKQEAAIKEKFKIRGDQAPLSAAFKLDEQTVKADAQKAAQVYVDWFSRTLQTQLDTAIADLDTRVTELQGNIEQRTQRSAQRVEKNTKFARGRGNGGAGGGSGSGTGGTGEGTGDDTGGTGSGGGEIGSGVQRAGQAVKQLSEELRKYIVSEDEAIDKIHDLLDAVIELDEEMKKEDIDSDEYDAKFSEQEEKYKEMLRYRADLIRQGYDSEKYDEEFGIGAWAELDKNTKDIIGGKLRREINDISTYVDSNPITVKVDTKEADEKTQAVKDKVIDLSKDIGERTKIRIFDGVSEEVFDVEKDLDALIAKLDQMALKMEKPVFHAGDLEKDSLSSDSYRPADSLQFVVERHRGDSMGTGTYFASNLGDIIEALHTKSSEGKSGGIYAADLGKYGSSLLQFSGDEEQEAFGEFLRKVTAFVMSIASEDEAFKKQLGSIKVGDTQALFNELKTWFDMFHVNIEDLQAFIDEQVAYVKGFASTSEMSQSKSIGTNFQQKFIKNKGIDITRGVLNDSYALGNLIFDLDKERPFDIAFGNNEDIAAYFYKKVFERILSRKAANPLNYVDDIVDQYIGNSGMPSIEEMGTELTPKLQAIGKAHANDKPESISTLNASLLQRDSTVGIDTSEAQKQIEALKQQVSELQQQLQELSTVDKPVVDVDELQAKLERAQEEIDELNHALAGTVSESSNTFLSEQLSEAEQHIRELGEEVASLKQQLTDTQQKVQQAPMTQPDDTSQQREQEDQSEAQSVEQLIAEYERLGSVLSTIEARHKGNIPIGEEKNRWDEASKAQKEVADKLRESGMYYSPDQGQWVEDIVNLEDKYKELLSLIESGDTKAISKMFSIDESELGDLEVLKENLKMVIDTLNAADGMSASGAKLSWWDGWLGGGRDLFNTDELTGALKTLGISDDIIEQVAQAHRDAAEAAKQHAAEEQAAADATKNMVDAAGAQKVPGKEQPSINPENTGEASDMSALGDAVNSVTKAVDDKTMAFSREAQTVQESVQIELASLQQLVQQLESIRDLSQNLPKIQLTGKDGTKANPIISPELIKSIEQLKTTIGDFDPQKLTALFASIKNLKINENVSTRMTELATGFTDLRNALDGWEGNAAKTLEMITQLSQKASALKDVIKTANDQNVKKPKDQKPASEKNEPAKPAEKSKDEIRADQLKAYNAALKEFQALENARVRTGQSVDKLGAETLSKRVQLTSQLDSIQKAWNDDAAKGVAKTKEMLAAEQQRLVNAEEIEAAESKRWNEQVKKSINFSNLQSRTTKLKAEKDLRPDAFGPRYEEIEKKAKELSLLFPLKPFDEDAAQNARDMAEQLDKMITETRNAPEYKLAKDNYVSGLERKMETWAANNGRAVAANKGAWENIQKELKQIDTLADGQNVSKMFDEFVAGANRAGQAGETFTQGLMKRFKSLGQYLLSFASFYRVIDVFKQAFNTVKQLDDALTEMRKVSDESLSSLQRYQSLSFNIADEVGTTAQQIQQSTADWLRLGESFEEAQKSAKESTILLNVSEFDNIDKATEALVSASQAYKDLDKIDIIDKLNNIGNNFSISTDQLATGLQNSAAVLMTQGNDIDEALALLTAGNAITQDISKTSAGITYARTYSNIRVLKTRKQLYRSKTRDGSDRAKTLGIIYKYMDKYYNVSSVRMMRFLYSLGFDKESYINRNGKENWRFKWSSELQESLDFFFYMRNKLKEELVICQ